MKSSDVNAIVHPILELLEEEHQALVNGRLDSLNDLFERKASLLLELKSETISRSSLEQLVAKSKQNQMLYSAALEGVRSAQRRIQAARDTHQGFSVYDRSGASKTLRHGAVRHSQRA